MKSSPYIAFILFIAAAGAYYYFQLDKVREQEAQTVKPKAVQRTEEITPEIQHPVPAEPPVIIGDSAEEAPSDTEMEEPLPSLMESDNRIKEILAGFFGADLSSKVFQQMGIIHLFVLTVDSLPKETVPIKYRLLPSTPGKFLVQNDSSDKITIDPDNFARYETYMRMLDMLDTELFVKWYTHFYPLIQEDYDLLGVKKRYFNDRFIFVIDHLLETPDVTGPIELVQPNVFYNFADPALQKLSSGQKILLRIGPANRKIVKAKLIELRKALASPQ